MAMQAYKLKGKIDASGNLVIGEPVNIPPGDVEVIVLQAFDNFDADKKIETEPQPERTKRRTRIKALQSWFDNTQPTAPDFDPDEARWSALKEKYDL